VSFDPYLVLLAMALVGAIFTERRIRRRGRRRPSSGPELSFPAAGFFAARADQIDEAVVAGGPAGRFPGVTVAGVGEREVASLGRLLVAGDEAELRRDLEANARGALVRVPSAIRDRLITADLRSAAERWSDLPELRRAGWTYADAHMLLVHLRALAATAQAGDADIWLWRVP
jgi:hypothetical protein